MEERFIGLDVGASRIGVAVSTVGTMAVPVETVEAKKMGAAARRITELVGEYGVEGLVVGWPLDMMGREGRATERVVKFMDVLERELRRQRVDVTIHRWDERMSTAAADRELDRHQVSRKQRKERVDQIAACHILQGFLDGRRELQG